MKGVACGDSVHSLCGWRMRCVGNTGHRAGKIGSGRVGEALGPSKGLRLVVVVVVVGTMNEF